MKVIALLDVRYSVLSCGIGVFNEENAFDTDKTHHIHIFNKNMDPLH